MSAEGGWKKVLKNPKNAFVVSPARDSAGVSNSFRIPATGAQPGESEEPGPGARLLMKGLNCLWALMMSDS